MARQGFAFLLLIGGLGTATQGVAQQVPGQYVVELAEVTDGNRPLLRQDGGGAPAMLPAPEARFGATRLAARAAARQNFRQKLQASLGGGRFAWRGETQHTISSVILQFPAAEANDLVEQLRFWPEVKRVTPVMEVQLTLDRALAAHRVPRAWARLAAPERGGEGVKIGVIDTGLDPQHPGFATQGPAGQGLAAPEGYPKVSHPDFARSTNGKVIVMRSYDELNGTEMSDVDGSGHGTGVAMVALGATHDSPVGKLSGAAPSAWLGVYRAFGGRLGNRASSAAILKAIDDAVGDGMDIINLSIGVTPTLLPEADALVAAIQAAAERGVLVVKSIGNAGPSRSTLTGPDFGEIGLTIGSNSNDRTLSTGLRVEGVGSIFGLPGDGPRPEGAVQGEVMDSVGADASRLLCNPVTGTPFTGRIVVALRGDCSFGTKIQNAARGGAKAVVVTMREEAPATITMAAGESTLPAMAVSFANGRTLYALLTNGRTVAGELNFQGTLPFALDNEAMANSSSRGPSETGVIKPDFVATGGSIYTAAQKLQPTGDLYGANGYALVSGTSFASPLVAGAAAVLRQARPGLRLEQYRSLLLNTATPMVPLATGRVVPVLDGGAGKLQLEAALLSPLTVAPASLGFGLGPEFALLSREITVTNIANTAAAYKVEVVSAVPDQPLPSVSPTEFVVEPGQEAKVSFRLERQLPAGEWQGWVVLKPADENGVTLRIPYWYGVPSQTPATMVTTGVAASAAANGTTTFWVRALDAASLPVSNIEPKVEPGNEHVTAVTLVPRTYLPPGLWEVRATLGAVRGVAAQVRVQFGEVVRTVSVSVQP